MKVELRRSYSGKGNNSLKIIRSVSKVLLAIMSVF